MVAQLVRLWSRVAVAAFLAVSFGAAAWAQGGPVRIAYGDVPSAESLHLLIALEKMKERGVKLLLITVKSEDLATQAVVGGDAEIGVGTPYAAMQRVQVPIRMFYQLSTLRFFPVINTDTYKGWKDLNDQIFTVHSRGSGTEAIMMLIAKKEGIKFKSLSYVPGSEARALAMLRGDIKATIVDAPNRRLIQEKGGNKFLFLPMGDTKATDDALFARKDFLEKNAATVDIMVEELLKVWREIKKNPGYVVAERARYKLLPDLPADLAKDIEPYFKEAAGTTVYPVNGGDAASIKDDFEFFSLSGAIKGEPAKLKVEDFWHMQPLDKAIKKLGRQS